MSSIKALVNKYNITAYFYDILDFPCEYLFYKKWRPKLINNLSGNVLEAGVGTGRNLAYYNKDVNLTAIDASPNMLKTAQKRAEKYSQYNKFKYNLLLQDASCMQDIASNQFDYLISTFLCCVIPNEYQKKTIDEFARVLKPGGKFKILEIVYSKNPKIRVRQKLLSRYVKFVFGASFERQTLDIIKANNNLKITNISYLKDDTYLLIEGIKL